MISISDDRATTMPSAFPLAGSVLGIDVGCSPTRRSSAVCRIDWDEREVRWAIARFRAEEPERSEIIAHVGGGVRLEAAAFDGPLRRGLDTIGRYRTAERMLTRGLQPLIGKPGQSSAPVGRLLNEHANACARVVLERCDLADATHGVAIHQKAVAEAFPSSFMGVLIDNPTDVPARRGDRSDTFFEHLAAAGRFVELFAHLLPGLDVVSFTSAITNHDDRAAFVCAVTALCVAANNFVAVGDEDGWIVLPPPALIRAWAVELLNANDADALMPSGRQYAVRSFGRAAATE